MPYRAIKAREVRQKFTCILKKTWVSIAFAKNALVKKFGPPNIRTRTITTLLEQLGNNRTDPANAFVEKNATFTKRFGQWAMSKLFGKKSKFSAFLTKTGRKRKLSQQTAQLVFQRIEQKNISISKPTLITGLGNKAFVLEYFRSLIFFR